MRVEMFCGYTDITWELRYSVVAVCVCSLVQWLKYSRKEYCELCKHRYSFTPSKSTCVHSK